MRDKINIVPAVVAVGVFALIMVLAPRAADALSESITVLEDRQVTCGSTATALHPESGDSDYKNQSPKSITVCNEASGAVDIRIGGEDTVSTTRGKELSEGECFAMDISTAWCVAESSTQQVLVLFGR